MPRGRHLPLTWIIAAAAVIGAWGSAGLTPMRDALVGARAPSDFATDFVPAARRARGEAATVGIDVADGNREATDLGAPPYADVGTPYRAHPPPAVLVVMALAPLGFRAAALVWLALALAALAVIAFQVTATFVAPGGRRARVGAALFVALGLWPPVLHDIEKGQWSLIIAGLLAGAWAADRRGWNARAGALVALAAAFKVMPIVVLAAFVTRAGRRRRRAIAGAAAVLGGAALASAIVVGPAAWIDFVVAAPINTRGWQTGPANTLSLWGALARFLIGGPYARAIAPRLDLGLIARIVWIAAAATLAGVTWRRARGSATPSVTTATMAATMTATT